MNTIKTIALVMALNLSALAQNTVNYAQTNSFSGDIGVGKAINGPSVFGGPIKIDMLNGVMYDRAGLVSWDIDGHGSVGIEGNGSFDASNRLLFDTTGGNSTVDWGAYLLKASGTATVNWQTRTLAGGPWNVGGTTGIVTNNNTVWISTNLPSGTAPSSAAPNGSILTSTNGTFYVRSNAAWVLH